MFRLWVYLFPILENFILYGILIGSAQSLAASGAGGIYVTAITAIWAAVYSPAAFAMTRLVSERAAQRQIAIGLGGLSLCALALSADPDLLWRYMLIVATGIFSAVFCVPFQVFMKAVEGDTPGAVVRPTAMYTAAWSFGAAAGPFILATFSLRLGFWFCALLGAIGAIGITRFRSRSIPQPVSITRKHFDDFSQYPDVAWLGWLSGGICILVASSMRMLLPYQAAKSGFSPDLGTMALAAMFTVQAVAALSLIRSRRWMFRPGPAVCGALTGAAGLIAIALGRHPFWFYFGAVLYGLHSAQFYFYFVCYALATPRRSARNVAINETVVGAASMLSIAAGMLTGTGNAAGTLLGGALLSALVLLFQAFVLKRLVSRRA